MTDHVPHRRVPERFSRPPHDRSIRVCVCLREEDDLVLAGLSVDGFIISRATPSELGSTSATRGVEALVVDADLPEVLSNIAQIRRSDSVISTLPIVLVGIPGASLRSGIDAVEAGGDVFVPRPLSAEDLGDRLRALVELPGGSSMISSSESMDRPSILPEVTIRESTAIRIPSTPPMRGKSEPPIRVLSEPPFRGKSEPPLHPSMTPPGGPALSQNERLASTPAALSPGLSEILRAAVARVGGEGDLLLPSIDDDAVDELIPSELLEPLDAPHDALGEDSLAVSTQSTPSGPTRRHSSRMMAAVNPNAVRSSGTPTVTPLPVSGDARLTGTLSRFGTGALLGAAARVRASGLLVLRSSTAEWSLTLTSGHLLAISSSRSGDEVGPLLARLGAIPREAARFAMVQLDAGLRATAGLAARGYVAADTLAQALATAAREVCFDLLTLTDVQWEIHPLENANEIPLSPRSLDALLLLGSRARIEPDDAFQALGGHEATLSFRSDAAVPKGLNFTNIERDAIDLVRGGARATAVVNAFGTEPFCALLCLAWLGALRVEGPAAMLNEPEPAIAEERTRIRALLEAASNKDFFALMGISEWSTRSVALDAVKTRLTEVEGLRVRHPQTDLAPVIQALDEIHALLKQSDAWSRYVAALRTRG